ncbi:MAG: 50S ribosomal protein L3 [Coriobacteriia bacterium]|nr:50S ribosomal protein L3 [Coriobacteriia bacterium]
MKILGKKLGMTQVWSEDGNLIPVTVIEAGPCVITQVKTAEKDGYDAIQVGFGEVEIDTVNKPTAGHITKNNKQAKTAYKHLAEIRLSEPTELKAGDTITVADFEDIKSVNVSGTSKGKGFAGVIKRHNFSGGRASHGSHFHRTPGSIGQAATPARVFKGRKMPGRMGNDTVTVRNLDVVKVDPEQNLLLVKGAVPGGRGALLTVKA